MKLAIIGTGYVGLVSGACFAEVGHHVICIDEVEEKINSLLEGKMPIYEPGLEEMVKRNRYEGRLHFTTDLAEGIAGAEIIFIAVGTPALEDGRSDLSFVRKAAIQIGEALSNNLTNNLTDNYTVIATMSTVPVGTSDEIEAILQENLPGDRLVSIDVVSNPEFLREGTAVYDRMNPHRIVIGANNQRAADIVSQAYAPYKAPIHITNRATAELAKYACNAFLATKISFINEIANICDLAGADVAQITKIMGEDPRIGPEFLRPGIGYGGSCFPKDTRALDQIARSQGHYFALLKAVIEVNNVQKERFVDKMRQAIGGFRGKTIGILGLAFKPNTDDVREAPSLRIIPILLDEGAKVKAYDPIAGKNALALLGKREDFELCKSPYEAAANADLLAIVTEWPEFKELDLSILRSTMKKPIVCDGRNIFKPGEMASAGFEYYSIGRPNKQSEGKAAIVSINHE